MHHARLTRAGCGVWGHRRASQLIRANRGFREAGGRSWEAQGSRLLGLLARSIAWSRGVGGIAGVADAPRLQVAAQFRLAGIGELVEHGRSTPRRSGTTPAARPGEGAWVV